MEPKAFAPARRGRAWTVFPFELLAERKILEAMARGEFDNLPGAGEPLRLDDDSAVPADLRLAYRILKNAGCLPPELELRREILTLRDLIKSVEDENARAGKVRELHFKLVKLGMMKKRPIPLEAFPHYRDRILEKMRG